VAHQTINLVTHSTFSVAGNGSNINANYGEIKISSYSGTSYYFNPSIYGGNDDSNNNTINVSTTVQSGRSIYGGVNYPFVSNYVTNGDTNNVAIRPSINANDNTVNFNAQCDVSVVCGAFLKLDPKDDKSNIVTVTCPISLDRNTVNVSSKVTTNNLLCGAYVYLYNDFGTVFDVPTLSVSGNSVNINSEVCEVYGLDVYAARFIMEVVLVRVRSLHLLL
jgi:hypothetical protein